jgi:O-antigen/teichoic acid export membrane protein
MIKQGESVENLTRLSFTLLFVPAVIITFACLSYRVEIIEILYQQHVQSSARVFGILIFSFLGICVTYIFGTLLTANGSLRQLNAMAIVAVIINLTLNIVLIKRFGIIGAAIANATTQVLAAIYQTFLAKRIFNFRADYHLILRLFIFMVMIAAGSLLISKIPVYWLYSLVVYLVFGVLLAFTLGLMKVRRLYDIVFTND